MDPFSITCTTCTSRLKVRDESMIGQILACPNCHAMVLVEPPESQLTIGRRQDIDSQAITSEAIHAELESAGALPASEAIPQPDDEVHADDSLDPPAMAADWKPSRYQGYRQYGMIALVSLIAIVSSVALFGLFVQSSLNNEQAVADPTRAEQQDLRSKPLLDAEKPTENQTLATDKSQRVTASENQVEPPQAGDSTSRIDTDTAPKIDTVADAAPIQAESVENPKAPTMLSPTNAAERIFVDPNVPEDEPESGQMDELPESLQVFSNIFGQGLDLEPVAGNTQPQTQRSIQFEPPPALSGRYPSPPPEVDAVKRLEQPLGINLRATTLHDGIATIAQIVAVPITIDLQSLDSGGVDLGTPITARYLDTTAGDAMRDMLAKVGCILQSGAPGQMIVRASDEQINQFVQPSLNVSDLNQPTQVVSLVSQLAMQADDPVEVTLAPSGVSLQVTGSGASHWRVAIASESLRLSRNLPPKLPMKFTQRWLVDGSPAALPPPEPKPIVLEGDLPRGIEHWLQQVAQQQNARVLIDWPSAWQYGLTPEINIVPWPTHDNLESLEDELLSPYGLTIRDVFDGNWILTSERGLAMSVRTVVLNTKLSSDSNLLERIATGAGYEDLAAFPGIIDPATGRLIVRVPQFLQLQIASVAAGKSR